MNIFINIDDDFAVNAKEIRMIKKDAYSHKDGCRYYLTLKIKCLDYDFCIKCKDKKHLDDVYKELLELLNNPSESKHRKNPKLKAYREMWND